MGLHEVSREVYEGGVTASIREVPETMEGLKQRIQELSMEVIELSKRLNPVLQQRVSDNCTDIERPGYATPLADEICECSGRISSISSDVRYLLDNLQV